MNWRELDSITQFEDILMQHSASGAAFVVFKHSTRCIVSKMAMRSFEQEYTGSAPVYLLDLIQNRDVSNYIASESGVVHQSPQVIAYLGDEVIYHDSHHGIDGRKLSELIDLKLA